MKQAYEKILHCQSSKSQFEDTPIGIIRSNDQKRIEWRFNYNLLILSDKTNV